MPRPARTTTSPTTISISVVFPCIGGAGSSTNSAAKAGAETPLPGHASRPSRTRRRQSQACPRVTPCRRATSATRVRGIRLSAAIRAFSSSERTRRPVRPSITSNRPANPSFETSVWTPILPSLPISQPPSNTEVSWHDQQISGRRASVERLLCAALALEKSVFVKEKHYVSFVEKYTTKPELGLGGLDCYRLRGGVVHRGSFSGHPKWDTTHV